MLSAFTSAFRTPDLRKKLLFTVAIIALYRLGATIPSPGVSYTHVQACLKAVNCAGGGVLNLLNLFSGGALLQLVGLRARHHAVHHRRRSSCSCSRS